MAFRFPGADSVEQFWRDIRAGVTHVRRFTDDELAAAGIPAEEYRSPDFTAASGLLDGIDQFDAEFFGMSKREAAVTDPQHRLLLESCYHALENAGYPTQSDGNRIAVYASQGYGTYAMHTYLTNNLDPSGWAGDWAATQQVQLGTRPDFTAARVAFKLGLTGPAVNVATACSSSLVSVHLAAQALLFGDADIAVAGSAAVHVPQVTGERYVKGSIISRSGAIRAFDADADGTVGGNGVAAVVLKRLDRALADGDTVHAVVLGSGVTNDGSDKRTFAAPTVAGQRDAVLRAVAAAGVPVESIGYVEAHGTGTFKGDPIEFEALTAAFRQHTDRVGFCSLGSAKPALGHLDMCAGMAGLIKTILVLQRGIIPPLVNFRTPNPTLALAESPFTIATEAYDWRPEGPRRASVHSVGMGGTNAHVVVEQAAKVVSRNDDTRLTPPGLLPLSARDPLALKQLASAFSDHLRARPDLDLADVVTTATLGRRHFTHRLVASGADPCALAESIDDQVRAGIGEPVDGPEVTFMFADKGELRPGAALALHDRFAVVRAVLSECDRLYAGAPLLLDEPEDRALGGPALFALQVAQARLWQSLGVEPAAAVGHGAGEYAALHVTGAISLADGLRLATLHGNDKPRTDSASTGMRLEIGRDTGLDALWADIARLYRGGVDINWNVALEGCGGGRIPLPGYPFQRTTHWIGPPARAAREDRETGMPDHAVLDRVVHLTAHHLGYRADEIDADKAFVDLGADSLTLVSMLRDLETEFEVEISMRELLDEATTPRLVEQLITTLRAARVEDTPPVSHGPYVTGLADSGTATTHVESLAHRLTSKTRGSKEIAQRYRRTLADSRAAVGFRRATKEMLYPISARTARGSKLEDIDGNNYVDITMGFGALLFGHEPEFVTAAVHEHLSHGLRLGPRGVDAGEAALLLSELTGMERVAFANSGTEANSGAIRLARAATGRDRIVMFTGAYHGHIDTVLGRSAGDRRTVPVSPGIPDSAVSEVIVLEYGSDHSLHVIDELAETIAAVLVEPVQSRNPSLQPIEFVRSLRELTRRRGIVLLFDEMLTGLRPHQRGAQHHYGVTPDLATYGKALGGGFPIGAIAGRADIMDGIDGGFWQYGDDSVPPRDTTFYGGTYLQHPVSMAAARAVLTHLRQEGPALQERLNARTDRMVKRLNTFFADEEFPLRLDHFGSMFRFTHRADMELLYHHLMLRGVYVWEWRSFYLSTAHTDADIEYVTDAVCDSLRELRGAGYFPATTSQPAMTGAAGTTRPAATTEAVTTKNITTRPATQRSPMPDFSLYFFGDSATVESAGEDKYQQILHTARFADERGFHSLWLPERHFNTFGGLFPNPAVLAATLAGQTSRIRLNAGSVVLPLHDPIRIAEEWSMVDNLSGGRVGLGFGTGWHADDFALHPDRFDRRKEISFEHLADVRRLWRGETVQRRSGSGRDIDVRVHPRPVQQQPPMFLATTGRPESYEQAGMFDLGIVTNLMNQTIEELADNIRRYRDVRLLSGLDPAGGRVVVLVHTYLADDHETARAEALEPMIGYMRSSMMLRSAAVAVGNATEDLAAARPEDLEVLLRRGYDRYCDQRALIGSPDSCAPVVDALREAGVDEIGALIDFGMSADQVSAGLERLDQLRRRYHPSRTGTAPATVGQRRVWLACQLIGTNAYNEIQAVRLRGQLDQEALRTAVRQLVDRHPGLRTVFRADDQALQQVVLDHVDVPVTVTEHSADPDLVIRDVMREESARAYDLEHGPLLAPRLLRLAADDHVLVLGMHHLIADGHSGGLIASDLQELYGAAIERREAVFAEPAGSPIDASKPSYDTADLAWWRDHLGAEPPVLHLPTDRPRARTFSANGASVAASLDAEQTTALRTWSSAQGVTVFATLFTAWQVVLRRFSGQDEFVVGTTFGQRPPETRNTIGFFVSLLPLRCRLTDDMELRTAVRSTRDTVLAAGDHQAVDLDELFTEVNPDPLAARPLIPVSVDLDTDSLAGMSLPGLRVEPVADGTDSAPLEVSLMASHTTTGLRLRIRYDADLFDEPTIQRYLDQVVLVLDAMASGSATRIGDLPMLTAADETTLSAYSIGEGQVTYEPLTTRSTSAVIDGDTKYDADQLAAAAASVTAQLAELGVRRGDVVAIALPRGFDYIAAMLGVLRAGAGYLPLDLTQPAPRLAEMVADALPAAIVRGEDCPLDTDLPRITVGTAVPDTDDAAAAADDLLCLMYTSGSTGVPKGVVVEHGNVAATVAHYRDRLSITADDRVSWYSSVGFDATHIELWPALAAGAPLHIVPEDVRLEAEGLMKWLVDQRITVAFAPTAIAEALLDLPWPADTTVRVMVTGGERLNARPRPDIPFTFFNVYGPTECSVFCTWTPVPSAEPGLPSIGTPNPGMRLEIKDAGGRRLPPGAVGELYVGGPQVARGYRSGMATDRFTVDADGRRWYRTGDVVRWRTDGHLAFVGRTDDQVQIRGVRVEPAEVARAIRSLPGVRDAKVVADIEEGTGHSVLTCFVQLHNRGDGSDGTYEWRMRLAELLPRPMIPQNWHFVDELPLTVNGKWDKRRTTETITESRSPEDSTTEDGGTAAAVREVWVAVLESQEITDDADFFALGGHSLSAVVLLNRIRERFGVSYRMGEFFDDRTIRAMVTRLSSNGASIGR